MILINEIRKPNSSQLISMDEFIQYYKLQLFGNVRSKQIDKIILRALKKYEFYHLALNSCQVSCLIYLFNNHDKIIYGKPSEHERIIREMKTFGYQSLVHDGHKLTEFGEKIQTLYNYDKWFRSNQERGIWYAKHFNLKTCPYCNSQYTLYVTRKSGKGKAKFQFDHFFSKDKFPYLAISMFNLIPSCYNCNHNKSSEYFSLTHSYHPYVNDISKISTFFLDFPDDFEDLNIQNVINMNYEEKLTITFKLKEASGASFQIDRYNSTFDIEEIYSNFKSVAHRLLIVAKMNGPSYRSSILPISGLFDDEKSLIEFVLQTSINENKILDHALSKFIIDISIQLRII